MGTCGSEPEDDGKMAYKYSHMGGEA